MVAHILGYFTLVWIILTTLAAARWLWVARRETRTWMQRVPVPAFAHDITFTITSGAEYVGYL